MSNAAVTMTQRSACPSITAAVLPRLVRALTAGVCVALAACGGGSSPDSGTVDPTAVAPTITQQPASLSVTAGQPATFSAAANGTAPITWQWQRNGTAIAGATAATYTFVTTTVTDSSTVFSAVATNAAGSATSDNATLTVTAAAPVLTITTQPTSTTIVAGATVTFSVAGTCSSRTFDAQWQRSNDGGATFVAINEATALTYSFTVAAGDSGAQFQAVLDCGGQSTATSAIATLTVTAPSSVSLSVLPMTGLRAQAQVVTTRAIDQESSGSYVFATQSKIERLSADLSTITPVAGGDIHGSADGPAATATFYNPCCLTHDSAGNIYVADTENDTIRRIGSDGNVTTLAGLAGTAGMADGTGAAARFALPTGITMGPDGDLYVVDQGALIRRVTTAGVVTTYAGSLPAGYADGPALSAQFNAYAIATAANGDVLVGDGGNNRLRRILRSGNGAGMVETLAGNGGYYSPAPDGTGITAVIAPVGLAVRGNVLIETDANGLLRQVDLTSTIVTTLVGLGIGPYDEDGPSSTAGLESDSIVTTAPNGGFMLADARSIRAVGASGAILTIATGLDATDAGTGVLAQLPFSFGGGSNQAVAVDPSGNVVIADGHSKLVRRISPSGVVTLVAGLASAVQYEIDGTGSGAQFVTLGQSVLSDSAGVLYVSDAASVRKIDTGNVTTLLAGMRCCTNMLTDTNPLDGSAAVARFGRVAGMALAPNGILFVADPLAHAIRRVDQTGNVTTYAGVFGQESQVDGPIATARFVAPSDVALAPDGTLYVVDNGVVRTISADGTTVASLSVGGTAVTHILVDGAGTLYIGTLAQGLYSVPAGSTSASLVIGGGDGDGHPGTVTLAPTPHLAAVDSMALLGPKQLVILSGGFALVLTLP